MTPWGCRGAGREPGYTAAPRFFYSAAMVSGVAPAGVSGGGGLGVAFASLDIPKYQVLVCRSGES